METIDFKEIQIKKLKRELAINRNEQDRIRIELGMDTREEWLYRDDPSTTEEEAELIFNTPEGHELIGKECEEKKLMEQLIFLETGEDPKERSYRLAAKLMEKYEGDNAEPWHPRR